MHHPITSSTTQGAFAALMVSISKAFIKRVAVMGITGDPMAAPVLLIKLVLEKEMGILEAEL